MRLVSLRFSISIAALLCATAGVCVIDAGVSAQSLADLARQEEARRRAIAQPARVYTNQDLVAVSPPIVPSPAAPVEPDESVAKEQKTPGDDSAKPAGAEPGSIGATGAAANSLKTRADWSGRMQDLQTRLDRDQILADALQSRVNALTADFSARDDPAQRAAIGRDRQKALDELARMVKAVSDDRRAIADLEESARRASVPPGWLR
jgi:hypothetical protein